jgi:hypothetical protein
VLSTASRTGSAPESKKARVVVSRLQMEVRTLHTAIVTPSTVDWPSQSAKRRIPSPSPMADLSTAERHREKVKMMLQNRTAWS